ncbi:hypothetical protein [uncultured Mediterranean phage uvMED]|nr:hypothetical protein [uncultured Mediterranean phage uvMED]|tara:strand:- start:29 stop:631 length:603 start_codon:yes stop_codon:yes gene_type:complete
MKLTSKQQQSKIADDEYYAGLQSLIEKDVIASKYFNPDEITYPLMEKSGNYNYAGIQIDTSKGYNKIESALQKRRMTSLLNSPSSFKSKLKSKKSVIAIFQNPVSNAEDINKMRTILHEVRHKAFNDPINKEFLKTNNLDEEVLNRFLDYKIFPELRTVIKNEIDGRYEAGFKQLENKYRPAAENFIKLFNKNSKSLLGQ